MADDWDELLQGSLSLRDKNLLINSIFCCTIKGSDEKVIVKNSPPEPTVGRLSADRPPTDDLQVTNRLLAFFQNKHYTVK